VENSVILSTDADGLNFNGNATNCTVKNNFLRNTGDDGLAIWSYPAPTPASPSRTTPSSQPTWPTASPTTAAPTTPSPTT
jgi:hypothetical protein